MRIIPRRNESHTCRKKGITVGHSKFGASVEDGSHLEDDYRCFHTLAARGTLRLGLQSVCLQPAGRNRYGKIKKCWGEKNKIKPPWGCCDAVAVIGILQGQ
jgi:hypothetical protein